ncbi:MAG: Rap1a/Tai family immunity protein [bacterium]
MKIILIAGLILSLSSVAFAGDKTAGELYDECHKLGKAPSDPKALISDVYCATYIDGVIDGNRITSDLYPQSRFICMPNSGVSVDDAIGIFSKWLQKYPKEKKTPARSGVLLSLKEKFPCKK